MPSVTDVENIQEAKKLKAKFSSKKKAKDDDTAYLKVNVLQTLWMCALCHQRSAQDELGDLFGPYYVNIRPEDHWPSFLFKKSLKTYCIDVWFHGDCILWAPDIQMKGNQLTCLEEKLHQFWKQNCWVCKNSGATINVDNRFMHFGCAKKQGRCCLFVTFYRFLKS
ncbi:unnamed protein product [Haemonchus placei]|uniref:PHD-type domain-containing protein n=1 Tax=Haemonchus placei TaxID=6290 RepID=A0A158QQQ7_HAEPC|nr:unnamed protein product [Haemonchus placei]